MRRVVGDGVCDIWFGAAAASSAVEEIYISEHFQNYTEIIPIEINTDILTIPNPMIA